MATSGQPLPGACLQDDAPCSELSEELLDVSFSYAGAGCESAPNVSFVGGNCLDLNATSCNCTSTAVVNGTNVTTPTGECGAPARQASSAQLS